MRGFECSLGYLFSAEVFSVPKRHREPYTDAAVIALRQAQQRQPAVWVEIITVLLNLKAMPFHVNSPLGIIDKPDRLRHSFNRWLRTAPPLVAPAAAVAVRRVPVGARVVDRLLGQSSTK